MGEWILLGIMSGITALLLLLICVDNALGRADATKRYNELVGGWDVMEDGKRLFSLEFVTCDPPFFDFKVVQADCPPEKVGEILNSVRREPRQNLIYKSRATGALVDDTSFAGGYDGQVARVRDYRAHKNLKWWQRLVRR